MVFWGSVEPTLQIMGCKTTRKKKILEYIPLLPRSGGAGRRCWLLKGYGGLSLEVAVIRYEQVTPSRSPSTLGIWPQAGQLPQSNGQAACQAPFLPLFPPSLSAFQRLSLLHLLSV